MRHRSRRLLKAATVPVVAAALALWSTGTADATAYRWQGYSRDGSWNCGGPGSTIDINNLYVLPCTKVVGPDWQIILIVTAGGDPKGVFNTQTEDWGNGNTASGQCSGGTSAHYILQGDLVNPYQSYACFSPTLHNPNTWVWGYFDVTVNNLHSFGPTQRVVSPTTLTGS